MRHPAFSEAVRVQVECVQCVRVPQTISSDHMPKYIGHGIKRRQNYLNFNEIRMGYLRSHRGMVFTVHCISRHISPFRRYAKTYPNLVPSCTHLGVLL